MSELMQHLKTFEQSYRMVKRELDEYEGYSRTTSLQDGKIVQSLRGKIILDPELDPDPWGYHGMSLAYRLECMGWT